MKKQAFFLTLLSVLLLTACSGQNAPSSENSLEPQSSSEAAPEVEDLGTKEIHTELQKGYIEDEWTAVKTYVPYTAAETSDKSKLLGDVSQPLPIALGFDEVDDADSYFVEISKYADFKESKVIETEEKSYDFYNSEIGQEYYFRAAASEEELADAKIKKFDVDGQAPRNLRVDGVINFRDVGGWKTDLVENAVINQGLYYRCAQFNSITAEGKATLKELGIKLDIDMRDRPPATSPATSDDWEIEILNGAVASGTEPYRWEGKQGTSTKIADTYKVIFEAIAEADEKPIALHCTHGADRTGIVSFFLLALCGVGIEDLGRDYMFTRFAGERAVWHEDEFDNWVRKTEALEGETFAEKTYNHMLNDFNIEADTLETIRELFVPGYERP